MNTSKTKVNPTLKKAHEWLLYQLRTEKGYSWTAIGELFEMSDKGAKGLLEMNRGSLEQLENVSDKIGLKSEFNKEIKKAPEGAYDELTKAIKIVIENRTKAIENPLYKMFLNDIKKEGIIEYLEKRKSS